MVRDDFLKSMLGAALVSVGGEVPLDHVESLMREKFEVDFHPAGSNSEDHASLEKYLVSNFSDICRVKRAADGHFVVRVLQLPSITQLLPEDYDEPEFAPLTIDAEIQSSTSVPTTVPTPQHIGPAAVDDMQCPQRNLPTASELTNGRIARNGPGPNQSRERLETGTPGAAVGLQSNKGLSPLVRSFLKPEESKVSAPEPIRIPTSEATTASSLDPMRVESLQRKSIPTVSEPVKSGTPRPLEAPIPHHKTNLAPQTKTIPTPQANRFPRGHPYNQQNHADRVGGKTAASAMKTPNSPSRSNSDNIFSKNDYQDDRDAATLLANLENQLAEECSVRGMVEPTFKLSSTGVGLKEVFCVATWGSEKIQSHPGVFATEAGAKAHVIKKMLAGIDEFAQKLVSHQPKMEADEILVEDTSTDQILAQNSMDSGQGCASNVEKQRPAMDQVVESERSNLADASSNQEPETTVPEIEDESAIQEDSMQIYEHSRPAAAAQTSDLTCGRDPHLGSVSAVPCAPRNQIDLAVNDLSLLANGLSVDLEPRIDMEKPVSQGYLTYMMADGSFMVQVKGPGLEKWERQTFAFDPRTPTEEIKPFRWYVVHIEDEPDVEYFDRVMCMDEGGPIVDDRGFVKLHFPDNGYDNFVDPSKVFSLDNHEEISRVPIQAVRIHAVGITGRTPVEELRVVHPPHHSLLFLPTDRSNCFKSDCAAEIPHVFIYDMALKRMLC